MDDPVPALSALDPAHPYSKIGSGLFRELAESVPMFFSSCGVTLSGSLQKAGWRLTPSGSFRRACWSVADVDLFPSPDVFMGKKVLLVNFAGYPDFPTALLADGLESRGASVRIEAVRLAALDAVRQNPSEMRGVNIARVLDRPEALSAFLESLSSLVAGEDAVILPAVFGLQDDAAVRQVRQAVPVPVHFVGTMPPSVPGIRTQMQLKRAFEAAGGTFLMGDSVVRTHVADGRAVAVFTQNLGSTPLEAEQFVLASGSFFSKGLTASPDSVREIVFGLDTDWTPGRENWYDRRFFAPQAYLRFGVHTDAQFRPSLQGTLLENLHCIGSVLSGADSVREGSGAGVAILTALAVARKLTGEE